MTEADAGITTPALPDALTNPRADAPPDGALLALAAELREAEAAFGEAIAAADAAGTDGNDPRQRAASARVDELIARIAAIPAAGLAGVAVKAGRICESLAAGGGCIIADAEAELAESLARDLARLAPEAAPLPGAVA